MQDYKHLREPKPVSNHPTLLESMACGIITGIVGMWILRELFIQLSGG